MQRSRRKSQSSALCVNASSCRSAAASAPSVPGLMGSQETVCPPGAASADSAPPQSGCCWSSLVRAAACQRCAADRRRLPLVLRRHLRAFCAWGMEPLRRGSTITMRPPRSPTCSTTRSQAPCQVARPVPVSAGEAPNTSTSRASAAASSLASARVERARPVRAADHGVDLRIRIVVVVVEEAAEAVHQPLERVGGGARLAGGIGQVDGLVAVFAADTASWSDISSSASSQVTRSNCAEPRGPTRRRGPHEAVGAVRPRAHGQPPAVARRGGLVRRHACKARRRTGAAQAGSGLGSRWRKTPVCGFRRGKRCRFAVWFALRFAPMLLPQRLLQPPRQLRFRKRNRPAPPCGTAGRLCS